MFSSCCTGDVSLSCCLPSELDLTPLGIDHSTTSATDVMASHTSIGGIQNEMLGIHQGKVVHGVTGDPSKPARSTRKALQDISNVGKKPLNGAAKGPALKERSAARGRATVKNASVYGILADEDISERAHFTGNDMQNHLNNVQEKRVRKKVVKVVSALHNWSDMSYGLGTPTKEFTEDKEDVMKLELEPEVLPVSSHSNLGDEEIEDLLFEPELYDPVPLGHTFHEFKLKEDVDFTCF